LKVNIAEGLVSLLRDPGPLNEVDQEKALELSAVLDLHGDTKKMQAFLEDAIEDLEMERLSVSEV